MLLVVFLFFLNKRLDCPPQTTCLGFLLIIKFVLFICFFHYFLHCLCPNKKALFYAKMHRTNKWNDCLIKAPQSAVFYKSYSPHSLFLFPLPPMNFNRPIISHHIPELQQAFLSHLLVIKWIDFCFLWVINPAGLQRLQRGSHREAFLMDSHRKPSIHRANEIGLQDGASERQRENSQDETQVQ